MLTFYRKPLLIHQGHMQWLWDHQGRRYLDMIGGIVTVSVGHSHPKVTETLHAQSKLLWHTTSIYMQPRIHEYAEKLTAKLPGNLKVVYFVNSGSEANDMAMYLARLHTGRSDIISLQNAYHGASPYSYGLTSLSTWKHNVSGGVSVHHTPVPDVYQGPWGGANCRDSPVQANRSCSCSAGQCEASDLYLQQLENVIKFSGPKQGIAAFFAESIQGVGGTVQFPKNFLNRAFELVRASGGICVSDEVQTGFGRTGEHFWGFEGHGVIPDIVTMAKGIANGFPMGAVVTTPEISRVLQHAYHFNTFGGNPLACAVGSTVLDVIEEEKCQEISQTVGTYLLTQLAGVRDELECVGDVRGKGLMIGVELVKDKKTRKPLSVDIVNNIWETTKDLGLLVGKGGLHGNVLRIKPPMCISQQDADFTVAVLRHAIRQHVQ